MKKTRPLFLQVVKPAAHQRGVRRVHLGDVDLDELHQGVLVEVLRELRHEVVQVADVDERPRVLQLRLVAGRSKRILRISKDLAVRQSNIC